MGDFIFDSNNFGENEITENLLGLQNDPPNISEDFMKSEYGDDEIDISAPVKYRSKEEIAADVEDAFLSLLGDADYNTILAIGGECINPTEVVSEESIVEFQQAYSQAVLFNPAIKWYPKLVKMLPNGKFRVESGQLMLGIKPQFFKKTILPFLGDFRYELREDSPIVELIYGLAERIKDGDLENNMSQVLEQAKQRSLVEPGLVIGELDFSDQQMDTTNVSSEVEDTDSLGGSSINFNNTKPIDISLQDLASKTIAEYLIEKGVTEQAAMEILLNEEGFTKQRINEITTIVRHMILNKTIEKHGNIRGNRGSGNVDFNFRF